MTQDAVVTKLVSRHVAEVEVERGTACGGTCESCEACVFQNRIRAEAVNKVSALPGQKVVIESKTSDVLGVAFNVIYQRKKKASPITFEIIQIRES